MEQTLYNQVYPAGHSRPKSELLCHMLMVRYTPPILALRITWPFLSGNLKKIRSLWVYVSVWTDWESCKHTHTFIFILFIDDIFKFKPKTWQSFLHYYIIILQKNCFCPYNKKSMVPPFILVALIYFSTLVLVILVPQLQYFS